MAYDEGAELPYEMMHDGVGENVVCLFFGWSSGLIFWWIAGLIWKQPTEQDAGDQTPTAVKQKPHGRTNINPEVEARRQ